MKKYSQRMLWVFLFLIFLCSLEARTVRVATFNIENGPDASGTNDYAATKSVLWRMNADIVAFQEILATAETNWRQMAADSGYPHVAFGKNGTTMSGTQRLGFFSRFPILSVKEIASPSGANELTRRPLRIVVEVPGAANPLVIWNMHHKADTPNTEENPLNQFRRAIESHRIVEDINAYRAENPEHDEFLMVGDLNDDIFKSSNQTISFDSIPQNPPGSYQLGSDISFPVAYRAFPDDIYAPAGGGLHRMDVRQQNGTSRATRPASGKVLDYLFVSSAIKDSPLGAPRGEVYYSAWDAIHPGMPKSGDPLPASTSLDASDHLAVFADIEIADSPPSFSFSPLAAMPGVPVMIDSQLMQGVTSVLFGGVEAEFQSLDDSRIMAVVPEGAVSGPITLQFIETGNGTSTVKSISSQAYFHVAAAPTPRFLQVSPSSLRYFLAERGSASESQTVTFDASGLDGPLRVEAPAGFEISLDGVDYSPWLEIAAPARNDRASNYGGVWRNGSNAGNGFQPWDIRVSNGTGLAEASIGDPTLSGIAEMGAEAFVLRASPESSEASAVVERGLTLPLAIGEALTLDWGTNWDANNGNKGITLVSGSASILHVTQYGFPGQIYLGNGSQSLDTGLLYGTQPMRWTFRQLDAHTLRISATSRLGGSAIAFSQDIAVHGAVSGFRWHATEMEPDPRRFAYFDRISIEPREAGGGALEGFTLHVRLAAADQQGVRQGALELSCAGEPLGHVVLSGSVNAIDGFEGWALSFGLDLENLGARNADPDGDGHSNHREFFFGGHPLQGEGSLVRLSRDGDAATISFIARRTGTAYQLQGTTNLSTGPWSPLDLVFANEEELGVNPSSDYIRKETTFMPPDGNFFFRIEARENP